MKRRKLYKEQKNSIYKIAKSLGASTGTFYRYFQGVEYINNMSVRILFGIAEVENIDPKELWYKMKEYLYNGDEKQNDK